MALPTGILAQLALRNPHLKFGILSTLCYRYPKYPDTPNIGSYTHILASVPYDENETRSTLLSVDVSFSKIYRVGGMLEVDVMKKAYEIK